MPREELAAIASDDLRALRERLTEQHEWLRQRWRATGGDQDVVMQLLRLWVEGRAVVEELARRSRRQGVKP